MINLINSFISSSSSNYVQTLPASKGHLRDVMQRVAAGGTSAGLRISSLGSSSSSVLLTTLSSQERHRPALGPVSSPANDGIGVDDL